MEDQIVSSKPADHPAAIISFIMSILGFCLFPLVGSIGGILAGNMAIKDIDESPEKYTGRSWARLGVTLGWLGIAVSAILCILGVLALLLFVPFWTGVRAF
jgi:hypothetical protein